MSASTHHQPDGASNANGHTPAIEAATSPTTSARHGRARHARTNASLTSSIGSSSTDNPAPFPVRRPSAPNEAVRIFQSTGFDPLSTEPDTLFRTLTVKEVEAYERAVRSTANGKQEELRSLVGQRYEDLLGTANTIIDMANSSSQLDTRLSDLARGVQSAAGADESSEAKKKMVRRKSFLPTQNLNGVRDEEKEMRHQEAVYVLGASLRLIMDAPEYVWKSVEKGKTLQAAWGFLLTRATWRDLTESGPRSQSQSALEGEETIASAAEAVALLKVKVKRAFPFIEKQWQSMLPMRKQIVHRATTLLGDAEIESMAVVDQLAALVLIDGIKAEHALQLLLSQRLAAMRRMIRQRRAGRSSHQHPQDEDAKHLAEHDSRTMAQMIILFARTLQHAVQIFLLPPKGVEKSTSQPLLHDLLKTISDPSNFTTTATSATSPTVERASLLGTSLGDGNASRQSAAALRALRRRSSHGLPTTGSNEELTSQVMPPADSQHVPQRALRVSTVGVIQALPSARVLQRLLPTSVWSFSPDLPFESQLSPTQVMSDLSEWSKKAQQTLIGAASQPAPDSLRSLLLDLSEVSQLAGVRKTLSLALLRTRRIVSRKLAAPDASTDERRQEALSKVQSELQSMEEAIDRILQERLLELAESKLKHAVQELLEETGKAIQPGSAEDDMPLEALFSPIEVSPAKNDPARSSRSFAAALQRHVRGGSSNLDRLARLYEVPRAALAEELQLYEGEWKTDERFASSIASIRARFESILANSRMEVETGLMELQEQLTAKMEEGGEATSLITRLIALLTKANEAGVREPVKRALEGFWRPQVEQRVSTLFQGDSSTTLLQSLSLLSESVLKLGPALAGPELATQVREILHTLSTSEGLRGEDKELLQGLLACTAGELRKKLGEDEELHRVRLALSPLMIALASTAEKDEDGKKGVGMMLGRAEPPSAAREVRAILEVSRKKMGRFATLPVR